VDRSPRVADQCSPARPRAPAVSGSRPRPDHQWPAADRPRCYDFRACRPGKAFEARGESRIRGTRRRARTSDGRRGKTNYGARPENALGQRITFRDSLLLVAPRADAARGARLRRRS